MKKLPITIQIALATKNPELFENKKHLQNVLKIKEKIFNAMYEEYKQVKGVA